MKRRAKKPTLSPADAALAELKKLQSEEDAKRAEHTELGRRLHRLESSWHQVAALGSEDGCIDPEGIKFLGIHPNSPRTADFLELWTRRFLELGAALKECGQAERLDRLSELVPDAQDDESRRLAKVLVLTVIQDAVAGEHGRVHELLERVFTQQGITYGLFRTTLGRFGKASWRWYKSEVFDPETQLKPRAKANGSFQANGPNATPTGTVGRTHNLSSALPAPVRDWLAERFLADPTPSLVTLAATSEPEPVVFVAFEDAAAFLRSVGHFSIDNLDNWRAAGWIEDYRCDLSPSADPKAAPPAGIARLNLPPGRHRLVGIRRAALSAPTAGQAAAEAKQGEGEKPGAATIIAVGNRQYRIGSSSPVVVSENEDNVLQAFIEQASLDLPELAERSGVDRPARVLSDLASKYGGAFAPAIRRPGGKGKGGYFVNIQAAGSKPAQ